MSLSCTVQENYVAMFNILKYVITIDFMYTYLCKIHLFRTRIAVKGVQYMELLLIPTFF